jgi:hypothetical protein
MRTHEAAPENDKQAQVDFCWNIHYVQMNNIYSHVFNNGSPLQAWRAGFREGVKMTLESGDVVDKRMIKSIHHKNYQRMLIWMSIGADAHNGMWAMYGSRLGCAMTNIYRDEWDWRNVRDFKWLNKYWADEVSPRFAATDQTIDMEICERTGYRYNAQKLLEETSSLGNKLRSELDLEIADLDKNGSHFFKTSYVNPVRTAPMIREEDVVNEIT